MSEQSEQILPEELAPVVDGEAIQADEAQPESLDSQAEEAAAERSEEAVEAEVEEARYVIKKARFRPAVVHDVVAPGEELTKVVEMRRTH